MLLFTLLTLGCVAEAPLRGGRRPAACPAADEGLKVMGFCCAFFKPAETGGTEIERESFKSILVDKRFRDAAAEL